MAPPDLDPLNQRELRKLLLSIKANAQRLDLLLGICDDRNLQDQLIASYEAELQDLGIVALRARLDPKQPSLRTTLESLVAQEPVLRSGAPAVVTVLNSGELLGVRLTDDQSEQERFFFSLQWTREALRQFEFPIVLWLSDTIATRLSQQAPDFWSWRGGVFEFVAQPRVPTGSIGAMQPLQPAELAELMDADSQLSIADLQQQITALEQSNPESPLLVTLYNKLGEAYVCQYAYQPALEQYEKALALAQNKKGQGGAGQISQTWVMHYNVAVGPFQSLEFYEQALALYRQGKTAAAKQQF
jgi:tetratricopeptide (TPR) repeat protein